MSTYAQFDDEETLEKIFSEIGTTNKFAVEFGCHVGYRFSNIRKLEESGWTCQYYGTEEDENIIKEFITAENVDDVFDKNGVPEKPDFMSIDVDGMDYWIWKALKREPRVVCIEYNIRRKEGVQEYNASNVYNPSLPRDFFGASKKELIQLGSEKLYKCIHENEANLFFVKI